MIHKQSIISKIQSPAKKLSQTKTITNQSKSNLKVSRFTIRFKLISIISLIVFLALGVMILFTSIFFNDAIRLRIQENNLSLITVLGNHIESELKKIRQSSKIVVQSIKNSNNSFKQNEFFQENNSYLYIGLGSLKKGIFRTTHEVYNEKFFANSALSKQKIRLSYQKSREYIRQTKGDFYVVYNASMNEIPIIALSYQYASQIVVVYFRLENLIDALQKSVTGLGDVFAVDKKGKVILHKNSAIIIGHANFLKLAIVKKMLESHSGAKTGQISYTHKNTSYMGSYRLLNIGNLGLIATIDADLVFQPVKKIQFNNLLIVAIVLCLSIIIVFYFSKTITTPIIELATGTEQIEKGNYDISLNPIYKDEVGQLTSSFNMMAVGLGEREKMKDAFGKFVNKEVAERVLRGEVKLGGEEKEVAVFFSDLRGFTAMSEKMSPENVVKFLNAYFTDMVRCVIDTTGVVDKYIGDAIMAHWGAIGGKGDITQNAINAALMMRTALIAFNKRHKGHFPPTRMGCGINTGPVISGQIGSDVRLEYTVIGDAVNLASRIEALNKPFATDILISADSYKKVKNIYKFAKMPSIQVKGKTEPQKIYTVLGRKDDPNCPANMDAVRKLCNIPWNGPIKKSTIEKEEKFQIIS